MKTDDNRDSEAVARIPKLVTIGNSFKLALYYFLRYKHDNINKTGKRKTCTRPLL
ncbi:MAG TPA: hypothetical protein VKA87_06570 [Nitrososphaeraceae archaeon]|nr:hypothetical protein [Nitrososphaeraceae archaeon]